MTTQKPGKVLVTGGAGFIGSYVVRALLAEQIPVRVFDSLVSGKRENVPAEAEFIQGDIRGREALASALEGVTHVVHLAAMVSVPASMEQPLETFDVNVAGTMNVFEAARAGKISRIVYASSASVYGNAPELPKREDMPPAPLSPYAFSKIQDERIASEYATVYGMDSVGLRFFNVYGKGQAGDHPYASVLPRWLAALAADKQIEVFGDGSQTRDFIHIEDVARAVVLALTASTTGAEVLNVASGTQVSLRELRDLLAQAMGRDIGWEEKPVRAGDLPHSVASVEAAKEKLGFVSSIPLPEGVRSLI